MDGERHGNIRSFTYIRAACSTCMHMHLCTACVTCGAGRGTLTIKHTGYEWHGRISSASSSSAPASSSLLQQLHSSDTLNTVLKRVQSALLTGEGEPTPAFVAALTALFNKFAASHASLYGEGVCMTRVELRAYFIACGATEDDGDDLKTKKFDTYAHASHVRTASHSIVMLPSIISTTCGGI